MRACNTDFLTPDELWDKKGYKRGTNSSKFLKELKSLTDYLIKCGIRNPFIILTKDFLFESKKLQIYQFYFRNKSTTLKYKMKQGKEMT